MELDVNFILCYQLFVIKNYYYYHWIWFILRPL